MKHPSITLARKAFQELRWAFDSSRRNYAGDLLDMIKAEERDHRRFAGFGSFQRNHTPDTASVNDCACLMACLRVAEYLLGQKKPSGADYLDMHKSCFQAAAIVDRYADRIREAWKGFELRELAALDYTDVVKVKRAAPPLGSASIVPKDDYWQVKHDGSGDVLFSGTKVECETWVADQSAFAPAAAK